MPEGEPVEPLTVVLVDDAEDVRFLTRLALERTGAFTVVAEGADGAEGVSVIERHRPDVMLLDVAMPVMDGLEMLPIVRQLCPDSTIVMYSGHPAARLAAQSLDLGADAYLEKGASTRTLTTQVQEIVRTSRSSPHEESE
jgi:DNA-binding NarL/FixJ family response regulator